MSNSEKVRGKKVLAAMSGGVDSSLAAYLLAKEGYDVTGVTMCLAIRKKDDRVSCCGGDAAEDAKHVCAQLGIPHFILDFSSLMEKQVIGKFTKEYLRGRTPNPCVDCNRYLKFGALLKKARALGFDYLATGHYARIGYQGSRHRLLRPADTLKDQTYFLYPIAADDLSRILFPLGDLLKGKVRNLAAAAELHVARKPESQDICFTPSGDYSHVFTDRKITVPEGDIVDRAGKVLGRHRGIIYYTVGQRGGLGISARRPLYVLKLDAPNNRIVVGDKEELFSSGLIAGDLNLFTDELPKDAQGKIRYRKKATRCRLSKEDNKLKAVFDEPQEAITPGQSVVFYNGEEVIGGGVIEEALQTTG